MITIRQSMLGDYEQCPFMCLDKWGAFGTPDPIQDDDAISNKYAMCGTVLHTVAEAWGKKTIERSLIYLDELTAILHDEFNKLPDIIFDDEEDREVWHQSLITQLKWLWDNHFMGNIIACEKEFLLEDLIKGLPPITGTIDRIDAERGSNTLIGKDLKSGKIFTRKNLASNIQATLYTLAIERLYGRRPVQFDFIFSKHQRVQTIMITDTFIELGTNRIKNIWYHILNKDFNPPYKPNKFFCKNFCDTRPVCPRFKPAPPGWESVELL